MNGMYLLDELCSQWTLMLLGFLCWYTLCTLVICFIYAKRCGITLVYAVCHDTVITVLNTSF